jgi:hypothetical protein
MFGKLPEELSSTFEKMIQQLDVIAKTMNIMDKRVATVENQVSDLYRSYKQKKEGSQVYSTNNYNQSQKIVSNDINYGLDNNQYQQENVKFF